MPRFIEEARTAHFVQVVPSVVRDVGGANNALVYIRMAWRCEQETRGHSRADLRGRIWWTALHGTIAAETGLTVEQVRYSLKQLREAGWVEEWDQGKGLAKAYSPTGHLPRGSEIPDTPSEIPEGPTNEPSGISDSLLLIETVASGGRDEKTARVRDDLFEKAWMHWPRKVKKQAAIAAFRKVKDPAVVARGIVQHGDAYAQYPESELQFVPHLSTWINGKQWEDAELPKPRGARGRQDDDLAMLQRFRDQEGGEQHALEA